MARKRAFLVLGPESSGTRLMTRLLIACGCHGSAEEPQPFDGHAFNGATPLVWRRSVPHAQQAPDIGAMVALLRDNDYNVRAIVTMREWRSMLRSQVQRGHCSTIQDAAKRSQRALAHIMAELSAANVTFGVQTLDGLIARPEQTIKWLADALGLPVPTDFERINDVNAKHWRDV